MADDDSGGCAKGCGGLLGIAILLFIVAGACGLGSSNNTGSTGATGSNAIYSPPTTTTTEALPPGSFTTGTYEVGSEIQPGIYKTDGSDYCYWEREKSNDGEFDSIIANGNANGPSSVTIKSSDKYMKFDGDCTWSKK